MSDELLPCPFCGKKPETENVGEGRKGLLIECANTKCVGPCVSYMNPATSRKLWNTRITPTKGN